MIKESLHYYDILQLFIKRKHEIIFLFEQF